MVWIWAKTSWAEAADPCLCDRGARSLSRAEATAPPKPVRLAPRFLLVVIESFPGLPAQIPSGDHFPQERTRTILVIAQALVQHIHDGKAHIEPDKVGQRQRSHRMRHAEFHDRIDRLGSGNAFH